ncbi:hypothetical protein HZF02_32705 (plasmid) [Pseudomonas yamanorum]|nr:hypothetical protein HZF02_32705 [Pseudomonas yamanorum]
MPQTNPLDFSSPASAEKALKKVSQLLGRAGQPVAGYEFSQRGRRVADVTYREAFLTLVSGQTITLRVNSTGDIYQVLINNSLKPLKEHSDTEKAVVEIAALAEKGQAAFQKAQARKIVALPKGMVTAKPKLVEALQQQVGELDTQISERLATIADLQAKLGAGAMTDGVQNELFDLGADAGEVEALLTLASAYVAARELAAATGTMLDDASTEGAKAYLQIGLEVVETNGPISLEEGNVEQARLQLRMAESFKAAIAMLDSANDRQMDDKALEQLVAIAQASAASEDEIADQDALATLLALSMVDVAEGIYFLSEKGRQHLNDNGYDAYGEPFAE